MPYITPRQLGWTVALTGVAFLVWAAWTQPEGWWVKVGALAFWFAVSHVMLRVATDSAKLAGYKQRMNDEVTQRDQGAARPAPRPYV